MNVRESLSVDVVAAAVTEIVREATEDVMLGKARKELHLENSLLNCEFTCYNILQIRLN
jgi:hypothetical protein